MTPNLKFNLDIEPVQFRWNGNTFIVPDSMDLLPDNQVKHLHKRVIGVNHDQKTQVPFTGRVVGRMRKHSNGQCFYLVENEATGRVEKMSKPQVID